MVKINVIKEHDSYALGTHEVDDQRAQYLISTGVAEEFVKDEPKKKKTEKGETRTAAKKTSEKAEDK